MNSYLSTASQFQSPTRVNQPIPLDPSFLEIHGPEKLNEAIRKIVCSIEFETTKTGSAFRLLGPEMSYHRVDPFLSEALTHFGQSIGLDDLLAFTSSSSELDLCFEDSWTGYFVAERFSKRPDPGELVLIHLDDHTDMMSTLLLAGTRQLTEPTSEKVFDPRSSSAWKAAIHSGAVSIGNYITPLFYSGCRLHVRHLRDSIDEGQSFGVTREFRKYDLVPDKQFAAVGRCTRKVVDPVGTYMSGSDAAAVLKDLPRAWTIVHVDLDYFINDFNGASRGEGYIPSPSSWTIAREKIDRFFSVITAARPVVDRWIIATSPGFCSGYHWQFLLSELQERIRSYQRYAGAASYS